MRNPADTARLERLLSNVMAMINGRSVPPPTAREQFVDDIVRGLAAYLDDRMGAPHAPPSPYLNYQQAAAYCGCAPKTLANAKCRGELRAVRGGAGVRFRREDLDLYMQRKYSP